MAARLASPQKRTTTTAAVPRVAIVVGMTQRPAPHPSPASRPALDESDIVERQQALAAGYNDNEIQRLIANGVWRRLRRGRYIRAQALVGLDQFDVHRLEVRAALSQVPNAVASHWSAGVMHRLNMYQPELSLVHLTRPHGQSSRVEGGVHHHVGAFDFSTAVEIDGVPVTPLHRTVLDIARHSSFEAGVVVADSALRRGMSREALRAELDACRNWPGARTAARVVCFADGRAESVAESLARIVLDELGLPKPELQTEWRAPDGTVLARTDFYFPDHHTVVEFDGKLKYDQSVDDAEPADDEPTNTLWLEKKREDMLRRRFGVEVVRMTWTDLKPERRGALAARIRDAFEWAEVRRARPVAG